MNRTNFAAVVTTFLAGTTPTLSSAAPPTDPLLVFGVLGSYSELEFKGPANTDIDRMPEGGLFLNYGNKMTARTGLVYHGEISGQYSEKDGQRVKDGQFDLDFGWRVALDERNFIDVLLGGGYKWNRFDPGYNKYDIDLTSRTPFLKAAAGYNHQFSQTTLRLEVGVRKIMNGESELEIHDVNNETSDLNDTTNPFVELSYLFNQQGAYPLVASLYYNRFKYELDGQFEETDYDQQTRDEYGVKIGLAF
ncbi:hypothetical protein [Pseudomonas sp. Irchel s3h17]|uniref:hypothetical protein n=1 Tax=Pseudomonas sp. Irchel s3h17 TaxID=2009182 RepID=UPI000BA3BE73|nr:hypothetical protein [Pseudomonas sp. Irchel s3h17]